MYNPADHKVQNQPFGVGSIPLNAKTLYYDTVKFVYRPFQNVAELEAYFAIQFKTPDFESIVNTGGTLSSSTGKITGGTNDAYWFPNGATAVLKKTNINPADYYNKTEIDALDDAITNNINTHKADTSNPHSVTKTQVGLGNVDNTSDLNKPISTATQTELDSLQDGIDQNTNDIIASIEVWSDPIQVSTEGQTVVNFPITVGRFVTEVNRSGFGTYTADLTTPSEANKYFTHNTITGDITFASGLTLGEFVKAKFRQSGDPEFIPEEVVTFGEKFTEALQDEVDRSSSTTQKYGVELVGASNTTMSISFCFNDPLSLCVKAGKVSKAYAEIDTAGIVRFFIVKIVGNNVQVVKTLPTEYNAVIGHNEFTIPNENIAIGETLAIQGTAKLKFGTNGPSGNRFCQGRTFSPGVVNGFGADGSYYSFSYDVVSLDPKPLDVYAEVTDLIPYAQTTEVEELITENNINYEIKQKVIGDYRGEGVTGGIMSSDKKTITIPSGSSGQSSYFAWNMANIDTSFNINNNLRKGRFAFLYKVTGVLLGSVAIYPIGLTGTNAVTNVVYTEGNETWYESSFDIDITSVLGDIRPAVQFLNAAPYSTGIQIDLIDRSIYIVGSNIPEPTTLKNKFDISIDEKIDDAISAYAASAASSVVITKVVKKNGTIGVDCDFNGNRGIQNAIESILDATAAKRYEILVLAGVYEATSKADFTGGVTAPTAQQSGGTPVCFIRGKNFVSIRGENRDTVIIRGDLMGTVPANTFQYYQTMFWHSNQGTVENVTVIGRDVRYPIHIDAGQLGCKDYVSTFINVKGIHQGNPDNTGGAGEWTSQHVWGIGTSDGQVINFINCMMIGPWDLFYHHTNLNFAKGSKLYYENPIGIHTGTNRRMLSLQSLGSGKQEMVELPNAQVTNAYLVNINDDPYLPTALNDQRYNNNDFKIVGAGCAPFVCRTAFTGGFALKITSKNTGSSSTVRFDTTSTAFPLIAKDKDYVSGSYITDLGEVNDLGYAYKDGSGSVFGYAIGRLDIGSVGVGDTKSVYIKSLGKRLGDCSTVNKTLTLIIDGVTFNVVFNKNYNGTNSSTPSTYSNAQILAEINAVIGSVATASEYSIANDYFPEITDYNKIFKASEVIEKGMVVVADFGIVRKALSTDAKITGIALDDMITGNHGRVCIKGYFDCLNTLPFYVKQETYSTVVKGDLLGISATPGKASKSATTKHFTCFENGIVSFNL